MALSLVWHWVWCGTGSSMITKSSVVLNGVAPGLVWHRVWCGHGVTESGVALV